MKALFLGILMLAATTSFAQILNIQSGATISKLDLEEFGQRTNFYAKDISSPLFFIGLQYLNRKYFDLSSNIGYLRKGGFEPVAYYDSTGYSGGATFTLDYLSLNTTAQIKYPVSSRSSFFLSVGPRLDYLLQKKDTYVAFRDLPFNKVAFGFLCGVGYRCRISRVQLSIRADYLPNSSHIYTDGDETLYDKTFAISASLGYSLWRTSHNKSLSAVNP